MKVRFIVFWATFMFLVFMPWGQKRTRLSQHVAKIEAPQIKPEEEIESMIDLISDLYLTLAAFHQSPDEGWKRNFFEPAVGRKRMPAGESRVMEETSLPHLSSIVVTGQSSYAIIDGQIVRPGDVVNQNKVLRIEIGRVILMSGGKIKTLTVD